MPDLLLTLIVPRDLTVAVEDLLLAHPALAPGFTTSTADGHGDGVELLAAADLVEGHAPRSVIRTVGPEPAIRGLIGLLKLRVPRGRCFYWLTPVIEAGRL